MLTKLTKLSDKAMLIKLSIKRAALTRKDAALTAKLQMQERDSSLTVLTKLFRSKESPVNHIMAAVNDVYAYHREHTQPYVDAGPRILPNTMYFEYTQEMKQRIGKVESLLAAHLPQYDQLVLDDIAFRNSGGQGRASLDDYPTAAEFEQSVSVEYRFAPMPDARHFLFDLSDEDIQACERAEEEAAQAARADVIARMLKPLYSLVDRLKEYQGNKGERFHTSLIDNVVAGCNLAEKLAINPPPELIDEIDKLRCAARAFAGQTEVLKGSSYARDEARRKLIEVAGRMAMFGG